MPNYDYICLECEKRFTLFFKYNEYDQAQPVCPYCESAHVRRRIGRVRVAQSPLSRLDDLSDPQQLDALDEDPRALGRMMRQMKDQVGEPMGPEFDEVVNRLENGHSPEQIEKDMPDLLGDESTPAGAGDSFSDD
ncbi:MAG: FmdB family zinc ribbon protein [Anaerolineaceae bacterium]